MKKLIVALLVATLCMVAPVAAFDWDALPTNAEVLIDPVQPFAYAYFDISIGANSYSGWCVDTVNFAQQGIPYSADLSTTVGVDEQWNKVNWVLNNKGEATSTEIQAAIWTLRGQVIPDYNSHWYTARAQQLVADADPSYVPTWYPDIGAVLIIPSGNTFSQSTIIEVPMPPCPPPVPEFPTMMIPVFLVGSLLVASNVLKKE
jgi:hypothetical protein